MTLASSFIISLLLTVSASYTIFLKYGPFVPVLDNKWKHRLMIVHCSLFITSLVLTTVLIKYKGLEVAFFHLRYGCVVFAAILTCINVMPIRKRIREHMFFVGMVLSFYYLLFSIPNYVISLLTLPDTLTQLYVVLSIHIFVLILSFYPLRKLLLYTIKPFLTIDSDRYWNTAWFIPITFFVSRFLSLGGVHNAGNIAQLLSSILFIAILVFMCLTIAKTHRSMYERDELKKELDNQKILYSQLRVKIEDVRKQRHDLKHHIAAVRNYIDTDDKEGLRRFCNELLKTEANDSTIPYSGNTAIDGVIYHYMQLAEKEQISFKYSGTIKDVSISDMDLCILLGNALDNAYEACMTIPENRMIQVLFQSEDNLFSIVVRNSFDGKVAKDNNRLLSRKRGFSEHGIGTGSAWETCERYGGTMDTTWDENIFTCIYMFPSIK